MTATFNTVTPYVAAGAVVAAGVVPAPAAVVVIATINIIIRQNSLYSAS